MRKKLPPWAIEVPWALGAAGIASLVAIWVLRLWDGWSYTRALGYLGDGWFYLAIVKGVLEHGWYLNNPDLGAPFGQDLHDFPLASNDALQLLIIRGLGLFFDSPFTVTNAFYLLTFPLTAITAFAALRLLGASRAPALLGAVLFSTTPYHFLRGETHLFFASYYLVPLSCVLVLAVMAGEPVFTRRPDANGVRAWLTSRSVAVVFLCILIALAGIYYAVFTALLVAAAAALRAIALRRLRALISGAVIIGVVGAVALLAQSPTILYRLEHGANPLVANRTSAQSELYALKLNQLVFPVTGHRIDPLERFTDDYLVETPLRSEPWAYLGAGGTIGLTWLLVVGVAAAASAGGRRLGTQRERHAAAATLIAFMIATVGGISAIIAYALTPQIRGWGRMSIFIAFFALLALTLLVQRLMSRVQRSSRRPAAAMAVVGVVLVAGVVEQTTPEFAVDHDLVGANFSNDANFVAEVERALPTGSMVLQLPYAAYPESQRFWSGGGGDYQHMLGYLHSSRLKWSYGAMKGRPEDWLAAMEDQPLRALIDGATAAGFNGVEVDRRGYGDQATALQAALTSMLGPPEITSANGLYLFWDLRPRRRQLPAERRAAMGVATVRPMRLEWGLGMYGREGTGADWWRWADRHAEVLMMNPTDQRRRMLLDVRLQSGGSAPARTTVTFPDGATRTVSIAREGTRLAHVFDTPPGRARLRFDTNGSQVAAPLTETRRLSVQLRAPTLMPEALCARPPASARSIKACTRADRPQLP